MPSPNHLGSIAHYINHSCDPNCTFVEAKGGPDGHIIVMIRARRDLLPGEELTIDYGKVGEKNQCCPCFCGTSKCRNYIMCTCKGKDGTILYRQPSGRSVVGKLGSQKRSRTLELTQEAPENSCKGRSGSLVGTGASEQKIETPNVGDELVSHKYKYPPTMACRAPLLPFVVGSPGFCLYPSLP